jgi:hypothetical protein
MERCALGVWGAYEPPPLPESIRSIVGRLFHRAREVILERGVLGATSPKQVDDIVAAMMCRVESELAAEQSGAEILPLRTTFGVRPWMNLVAGLKIWAKSRDGVPRPTRRATRLAAVGDGKGDAFGVGTEPTWSSQVLRLRGRPDEAGFDDATLVVTEYKTGRVATRGGRLLPSIAAQMHLYLLMGEVLSGRVARGRVSGHVTVDVPWNGESRLVTRDRVQQMSNRFDSGATIAASAAARPGPHCIACRLRPRCASYLADVPAWWRNDSQHPRPLPLDVWGTATDVRRE